MKYMKMINELKNNYVHRVISKVELYELYKKIYSNNNTKTFENMISLLKQRAIITNYSNEHYIIMEKALYKIKEQPELKKIKNIILKEYKDIKTIVWNTHILNEFTHHYIMNTYIVVETERFAVEIILMLLKEKLMKKYTIITESMYNKNKDLFLNNENLIIVKPLNARAPLNKNKDGILEPTLEKIMIDIYKDKLYEFVQGKELEHIYINIFESYSINFKKLYAYAKDKLILEQYKNYIMKLKVLEKI